MNESTKRYRREQELMLSAIHSMGMRTARDHLGTAQQQNRPGPTSWLGQQRKNVGLLVLCDVVNILANSLHQHSQTLRR